NHGGHARERIETRSVPADHRVLADESPWRLEICENNSHRVTSSLTTPTTTREYGVPRQVYVGGPRGDRGEDVCSGRSSTTGPWSRPSGRSTGTARSSASVRAAAASLWIASSSSLRFAREPRCSRAVASLRPASARFEGSATGPPNDFGWRMSLRT